jgi:hypothetical protein
MKAIVRDGLAALLAALLVVALSGALDRTHVETLDPHLMAPQSGQTMTYPLGVEPTDGDGHLDSRVELFEDEKQLGPAHAVHEQIRLNGHGPFSHWGRYLYFSSSDGSNPRFNKRVYTVRYPVPVPPLAIAGLFLLIALLERRRLALLAERFEQLNPAWLALAVGLLGLAVRVFAYARYHDQTLESVVKGVPVSDGSGWDAMSSDFALGRQTTGLWFIMWDALRPFRWMFMGAIYALTRPDLRITEAVQIALGALSGVLLFEALRRLATVPVALLVAVCHALSMTEATYDLLPGCEAIGAFFGRLFFVLFVIAATTVGDRRNRWWWLGGGIALGLANLTRPELMAAIIGVPAALGLLLTRASQRRGPLRAWLAGAALFALGLAITMGPWSIRQRVKYGTWSISANSSEVLFAATSPEYHGWSPAVSALAGSRSIRDRVAFYDAKLKESLPENSGYWIKSSLDGALRIGRTLVNRSMLAAALAVLFGIAIGASRQRRELVRHLCVGAALCAAVALLPDEYLFLLPLAGVFVAAALRAPAILFAAYVASGVLAVAFSGVYDPRLHYTLQVPALGLAIWFCAVPLGLGGPLAPLARPDWGRAQRPVFRASLVAIALVSLGLLKATAATLRDRSPPPLPTVDNPSEWIKTALAGPEGAPYAQLAHCLQTRPDWIPRDYLMRIDADEAAYHWNPLFNTARRYPFSVFQTFPAAWDHRRGAEIYGVWPGDEPPPIGKQLVLIGVRVERPGEGTSFETIAIGDPSPGGQVLHPPIDVARLHAAELARACPPTF